MRTLEVVIVFLISWALFGITIALSTQVPVSSDRMWLACLVGGTPPVLWCAARLIHFVFIKRPHR